MRYVWLVAWREFCENARTKGFWIGIFLFPVIIVVSGTVPVLLARSGVPTRHFVLLDPSDQFAPSIRSEMQRQRAAELDRELAAFATRAPYSEPFSYFIRTNASNRNELDLAGWKQSRGDRYLDVPGFIPPKPRWLEVPLPPDVDPSDDVGQIETRLKPWLRGERTLPPSEASAQPKLFAAVLIPRDYQLGGTNALRYWSENQADTELRDTLQRQLSDQLRRREYQALGLDPAVVARVESQRAPLIDLNPRKAEGRERVGIADQLRQWAPSFFVYLLWISIFVVAQMLLNSVIEEKSNRIIEVLLSSVTPGELMLGKLSGVALTGGVMLGTWLMTLISLVAVQAGWVASRLSAGTLSASSPMAKLPGEIIQLFQSTTLLPGFIAYFLLGYILYATLFLTIGSLCNTLKDAQNLMGPVMLILMVPLFLLPFIPRDPNGPIATTLSWIPLYTPFVMMNRITASPPLIDVVGTGLLLVAFDLLILWACGRIFRTAILRTGQPPRWVELFRWIRGRGN
jgi:ABC-2 type transport system permease protein